MRDAVREYGRTVSIFAAAGLVLSLLVGLLARNPLGAMVVRAVLFALLFAGLGAGMQYVVRRFLPELSGRSAEQPPDGEAAAATAGSRVDIVLPEELPTVEPAPEAGAEVIEELPGSGDAGATVAVEELEAAEPAPQAAASGPSESRTSSDELFDELPEIAPTTAAAGAGRPAARGGPAFSGAPAKPADATREVLERQDPAVLARGLRTMLKRDERS